MIRIPKWMLGLFLLFAVSSAVKAQGFSAMSEDVRAYLFDPQIHPGLKQGKIEPEYGDALVYAGSYIYHRAIAGEDVSKEELAIADAMVKNYEPYLDQFEKNPVKSFQDLDTVMHLYIGIGGVYFANFQKPDPEKQAVIERYLDDFKLIARHPGILYYYPIQPYGPGTVLFGLASFYLQYPLSFPDSPRREEFKKIGLDLVQKLDKNLWSETGQKYLFDLVPGYDFTYAYTNSVAVQALIRAYYLTGDKHYYDRAVLSLNAMEKDLFRPDYQGYLAAQDGPAWFRKYEKFNPLYHQQYMPLSALNYIVYGYLLAYQASGFQERDFLQKAEQALNFPQNYLWDHRGRVQHHLAKGRLSEEKDYCAGCNFQLLYNIFLIDQAVKKNPVIPLQGLPR